MTHMTLHSSSFLFQIKFFDVGPPLKPNFVLHESFPITPLLEIRGLILTYFKTFLKIEEKVKKLAERKIATNFIEKYEMFGT